MLPPGPAHKRAICALGLGLLLGLCHGCQTVETGPRATTYYERDGMWCGDYDIGFEEARVAARATLAELRMPIYQEGPERHGAFLDTRTPDNFEARVVLTPLSHGVAGTRIGVRVGGFGTHRAVCERLLGDIAAHLDAVRHRYAVPPPGAMPSAAPLTAAQPPPAHPTEPPLPPQPVPVGQP